MAILIEANKSYSFAGSSDELINNSKDFLMTNGFTISGETSITNGYSIHAKRGSETILRILGALFTTNKQLPIKINLKILNDKEVVVLISSNISGIGSSFGLKNKYNNCFNEIFDSYLKIVGI